MMVVAVTVPSDDVEPVTMTMSPRFSAPSVDVAAPSLSAVDAVTSPRWCRRYGTTHSEP